VRVLAQPGFVLHARPYRNASLLIEAFTPDYGRVGLLARGVRGRQPARRAVLQPFRELRLWYAGRGELKTLSEAEEHGTAAGLRGEALLCGYYLNELIIKLVAREDPHAGLFSAYRLAQQGLRGSELAGTLRLFEHRLLQELGYGLSLEHDCHGAPLDAALLYHYVAERGAVPPGGETPAAGCPIRGRCLLELRAGRLTSACAGAVKRLLREALHEQLGGRPLLSRELMKALHQLRKRNLAA